MPEELSGQLTVGAERFAVLVSRFNEFITSRLRAGAVDCFLRHGGKEEQLTIVHVPGSFELPFVARRLADTGRYDAIVCLGCVIRGQTSHFEYVASETAKGIGQVALATGVPTAFGVITAETLEQAIDRAGGKAGNKGVDAMLSAIELVNLVGQLPRRGS